MKNLQLLALVLCTAVLGSAANAAKLVSDAEAPAEVRQLARAAVDTHDNQGLVFAVVDKKTARVFVYDIHGALRGTSPVLLGVARGDESVPGIGERKMSEIRLEERTTPAGRFASEPGVNLQGEDIVWVDYDAAVSMHRVRTSNKAEHRVERLASKNTEEHRITYGCINVPASFYDTHVKPAFGNARGVIYVLPEQRPARDYFRFLSVSND